MNIDINCLFCACKLTIYKPYKNAGFNYVFLQCAQCFNVIIQTENKFNINVLDIYGSMVVLPYQNDYFVIIANKINHFDFTDVFKITHLEWYGPEKVDYYTLLHPHDDLKLKLVANSKYIPYTSLIKDVPRIINLNAFN